MLFKFLMAKYQRISISVLVVLSVLSAQTALAEMSDKAKKIHSRTLQSTPLYDDPDLAEYVSRVGHKVLAQSPHADRDYHFFVLDDHVINAFTPGHGLIYMNRGMLNLMTSEGQLAGVLGHEIGHNVGRHIGRSKTRHALGNIVANAASILTLNSAVGQTIALSNAARLKSFGREAELEADKFGAEYLYKSNYDPQEMLGMLGILKDNSIYQKRVTGAGEYHGLFTSHPRADKRLQKVISQAGELPPGEAFLGREEFREVIDGIVYGPNRRTNAPLGYERFTNESLGITFLHPRDWSRKIDGAKIILKDPQKTVQLKITIEKTKDKGLSTQEALQAKFPDNLVDLEKFDAKSQRDLGTLAKHSTQRVALAKVARNTFNFEGIARDNSLSKEEDEFLVALIRSFRRMTPNDRPIESVLRVYYKRLEPGETFTSLAKTLAKINVSEDQLRLLNGEYFPKGEAEPGTWIKMLRREKFDQ